MILDGVGRDNKEFSESNLHVCDRDDTKIVVYNMGIKKRNKKEKLYDRTVNSCKAGWIIKKI